MIISSIPKGNTTTNRDHYRPISILPCLSKICESCVNNQVQDHDREFQTFFEPNQYAYTKYRLDNERECSMGYTGCLKKNETFRN